MTDNDGQGETIRVKLTADDYARFNAYHGRWQLAGLFLFYWCLFIILAKWGGALGESGNLGLIIPLGFVLSSLLLGFQMWRIRARTYKIFDNDKLSQLLQNIQLTEQGIRHVTGEATVQVPWDDVYKAAETSKAFILYLSRNKVIMLPKRDVKDVKELKIVLRRHLPSSKLRLKA